MNSEAPKGHRRRVTLILGITLAACGGGSEGSAGPNPPPPPPPAAPPPPPAVPAPPVVATVPVPADYGIHDTFVRDGIAFLSLWNTGIAILDVGGGGSGGSPSHPVTITTFKPSNGSITSPSIHNSWWFHNPTTGEKRYLFVAQEGPLVMGSSSSGDIKVLDVSDLAAPQEVGFYRVAGAGPHNFWVDEPRQVFYSAFYNGGVVALNISGTLSGDLAAREIARVRPASGSTYTWGVMLSGEHLYAIDMVHGLMQLDRVTLLPLAMTTSNERWSSDFWIVGDHAYSGTHGITRRDGNAGDRVKIWRLSATGAPTLADSLTISATNISDVEVSDNGRLLVISTEVFIWGSEPGLHVYRLTDPLKPARVAYGRVASGLHTVTLGRIAGKLYAFGAKNPSQPALVIYDLSSFDN